jgi:perosamine synthetase
MNTFISVNEPHLERKEKKYVEDCLTSGWISSSGKYIEEFENKWAAYCGRKYGIAVSNGTVALELALAAFSFPPGSEIIMPAFTIISCALAIVRNKAIPVLVDCDKDTWTMDVHAIEKKITKHTKAIMVVHIYGHPAEMDKVLYISKKHHLKVLEDAAEAHGAEYLTYYSSQKGNWKRCGSFGDVSTFSFYANKPITTGEGGMILTDSKELADQYRSMRNLCFVPQQRFIHSQLGYNFRLTNIQAALGVAQVQRIDQIIKRKKWIGAQYTNNLKDISYIQLPIQMKWAKNIYWMYGIVLSDKLKIDAHILAKKLLEKNIETRPFFLGMHEQPVFQEMGLFKKEHYPVTEKIARKGLYLPSGLNITKDQIEYITKVVHEELQ